jgi:hypothetical protein
MSVVKKALGLLLIALLCIPLMAPKRALYYTLEQRLQQEGVILNQRAIESDFFGVSVIEPIFYYKGLNVAKAESFSLTSLVLFSWAEIETLQFDSAFGSWAEGGIERVRATHLVFAPQVVGLSLEGAFGKVEGEADLATRQLSLEYVGEDLPAKLRSFFKQRDIGEDGQKGWVYEVSF